MPHSDVFSPVLGQKKAQLSLLEGCTDDYTAIVATSFKTPPCLLDNTTLFAVWHFTNTVQTFYRMHVTDGGCEANIEFSNGFCKMVDAK